MELIRMGSGMFGEKYLHSPAKSAYYNLKYEYEQALPAYFLPRRWR